MPGFVKTPEEIAALRAALAVRHYRGGRTLSFVFDSDASTLEQLVPRPLELAEPTVRVSIGSHAAGTVGPYSYCSVWVPVRYMSDDGELVVASYMSADPPLLFGREYEGAPKKLGKVWLHSDGDRHVGVLERNGLRLVEMTASTPTEHPAGESSGRAFVLSTRIEPDGASVAPDAYLVQSAGTSRTSVRRSGTGSIRLRSGPHDALGELEVGDIRSTVYTEGDASYQASIAAVVPGTEVERFAYARIEDPTRHDPASARMDGARA